MSAVGTADGAPVLSNVARPRRDVLRGAGATGLGVTSLLLPAASSAASGVFTTGAGDDDLVMYVDATASSSWSSAAASSGSGTWTDLTGGNRSLAVGGEDQPAFAATGLGISGGTGAFRFTATDGATSSAAVPAFAFGDEWTVAAWVRFSDLTGWQNILTQGDTVVGEGGLDFATANQLYLQKSSHDLGPQPGNLGSRDSSQLGISLERGTGQVLFCYLDTTLEVGRWYHVVATGTSARVTVHLDGGADPGGRSVSVEAGATWGGSLRTAPDGTAQNAVSTRIGSDVLAPDGNQLRGALGFLQVWTRALTASEVAAQYAATRAPYHGTFATGLGDEDLAMHLDAADEASWSGTGAWKDVTGSGRSLTPNARMSHGTSGLGISGGTGAFVFDGSGGVEPDEPVPAFAYGSSAAWSISAWVRFSSLTGWQSIVGHGDRGDNAVYFQKALDGLATQTPTAPDLGTTRGSNRIGVAFGGRGDGPDLFAYGPDAAEIDTWYHVVVTADADAVTTYIDGTDVATAATESTYGGGLAPVLEGGTVTTFVGNRFDDGGDPLRGALAFLQIWTRALTDAEVTAQYAATRAPYHPLP